MYFSKWKPLKAAVAHVWLIEGGLRAVALEQLIAAMRDGEVRARYRRSRGMVPLDYWDAPAVNPVHLLYLDFTEIEVCVADLEQIWPQWDQSNAPPKTDGAVGVRLDELCPENAAAFEGTAEASAQTEGFVVNGEATTLRLSRKKLDAALDEWANNRWGPDFIKLPGREDLLPLARLEFKGSRITRSHARELRAKYATKEAKAGGVLTHKPPTNR